MRNIRPINRQGFDAIFLLEAVKNQGLTALLESVPEERRHQRIHAGHNCWVLPEEERFLTPEVLAASNMIGTRDELVELLRGLDEAGLNQVMILPNFDTRFEVLEDKVRISAPHLPEPVVLGDIIELVGESEFRWLGRDQDMINIAGKRGSLAHLNHRLARIPGVIDGVIFLPSEDSKRLAALVVAPGMEPSAILEALKEAIDPAFLPRPMYLVPMLPRQETGKLARKMVLDLYETARSTAAENAEPADSPD